MGISLIHHKRIPSLPLIPSICIW